MRHYLTAGLALLALVSIAPGQVEGPGPVIKQLRLWREAMSDRDVVIRLAAIDRAGDIANSVSHLISELKFRLQDDPDARVRLRAARALGMK